MLWTHISSPAVVLGRYSLRYAPVLGLNIVLIFACAVLVVLGGRVRTQIDKLPGWLLFAGAMASLAPVVGLAVLSVEPKLLAYVSLNVLAVWALLLHTQVDVRLHPAALRLSIIITTAAVVIAVVAVALTGLGMNIYQPDEAHYADIATSFYADGNLYNKSWLSPPSPIQPGLSWFFVAYGGLLERFGYSVYLGRVLSLAVYALFFGGLYAATHALYGRSVAAVALALGLVSAAFLPAWDYSPNRFVLGLSVWALYLMLCGRERRDWKGMLLHALVGLMLTQGLNLHPISIVPALAFSLFYGAYFGGRALWQRQIKLAIPVLAFGAGALLGTTSYIFTNVLPAGGFDVYLGALSATTQLPRPPLFIYTRWPSLFEQVLIVLGLTFLIWRRTEQDQILLIVLVFTMASAYLLDTQGYIWHVGAFYLIPIAAMLASLYGEEPYKTVLITCVALVLMALQLLSSATDWGTVRYVLQSRALPPYLYHELKAVLPRYVNDDDVIYSTHQLIWIFPHTSEPQLVSYAAEIAAQANEGIDSRLDVWETVQPTVIIFVENQMIYDEGMQQYLEQNPFQLCETLVVQETEIQVRRPDCAGT